MTLKSLSYVEYMGDFNQPRITRSSSYRYVISIVFYGSIRSSVLYRCVCCEALCVVLCCTEASHWDQVKGLRHLVLVSACPNAFVALQNVFRWTKSLPPRPRRLDLNIETPQISGIHSQIPKHMLFPVCNQCFRVKESLFARRFCYRICFFFGGCDEKITSMSATISLQQNESFTRHARVNPDRLQ